MLNQRLPKFKKVVILSETMINSDFDPTVTKEQKNFFKIGTRKSQLALVQTNQVKKTLEETHSGKRFDVVDMSTKGDEVLDRALYKIGDKSLFTKELENALIDGRVDMVVHR